MTPLAFSRCARCAAEQFSFCAIFVTLVVLGITGCKKETPASQIPETKSSFQKLAFVNPNMQTSQGTQSITLVSATECEVKEGGDIFLGSYTREGNRLRLVLTIMGTSTVKYYDLTDDGLTDSKTGTRFLTPDALARHANAGLSGMKFVRIEAGEFVMGSPTNEVGHGPDESQHKVKLTKTFMIGTTPVTQAQWRAVMGNNPSTSKGDDLPVENVSWNGAVAFCKKLSEMQGKKYRLPTEAEWEYACRAGTQTAYYFGNDPAKLGDYAWFSQNCGDRTHPVGQKKPNPWGLYDMNGSVFEWCSDYYAPYPAGDAVDPTGPAQGDPNSSRVLRGGSWDYGSQECRAAFRNGYLARLPVHLNVGFRCVLEVP